MRRCLFLTLLLIPTLATATVHRVPSQYATIQAGIAACSEGDTVLVAAGTYTGAGNRDLEFGATNLTLISEEGLESTVIDCEGEGRGLFFDGGVDSTSLVAGFTILHGVGNSQGGGIYCIDSSPSFQELLIEQCKAVGTYAAMGAGAFLRNSRSRLSEVTFAADSVMICGWSDMSTAWGGGLYAEQSELVLESCQFLFNYVAGMCGMNCCSSSTGAGVYFKGGSITVRNSLFIGNSAMIGGGGLYSSYGGGICIWYGDALLEGLTFVDNTAEYGAAVYCTGSGELELRTSIITQSQGGDAVDGGVAVFCSAFWSNTGNGAGHVGMNGNFLADPLFCDVCNGDYRLDPTSPCLPANNDCGELIGALGMGCEDTPVFLTSFTASPTPGAVDLSWQLGSEQASVDFKLHAEQAGVSWSVPWYEVIAGSYAALDEGSSLAIGGQVTYQLSGQLPGESWQLLRAITVDVPPAHVTQLLCPHPNPFNPTTELSFILARPAAVNLAIYDLAGRRVVILLDAVPHDIGRHAMNWEGRDEAGQQMPSGVYFARFAAGGYSSESKLVLLK